jgi:signal transduction histidine kinase/ligand-binding sensor domain-containing protein
MRRRHARPLRLALGLLISLAASLVRAAGPAPEIRIGQFGHTVWTARDGAPTNVTALAQDGDGYLWIGSSDGFFRFDGQVFEQVSRLGGERLPHQLVAQLARAPDGGLWIGYSALGGLIHAKDGKLTHVRVGDGTSAIAQVLVDARGITWVLCESRLWRIEHGTVVRIDERWQMPAVDLSEIALDAQGGLWVESERGAGVRRLAPGATVFGPPVAMPSGHLYATADGSVWTEGYETLTRQRFVDGRPADQVTVAIEMSGPGLLAPDDGLWLTHYGGLTRDASPDALLAHGPHADADVLGPTQGLTSTVIRALFADRDGNVWIGTGAGLERFRRTLFTPVKLPRRPLPAALAPAGGGAVYAATFDGELMKVDAGGPVDVPKVGPHLFALYREKDGTLWAGANPGLWHSDAAGRFAPAPAPDLTPDQVVGALARDGAGTLWLGAFGAKSTFRFDDGRWRAVGAADGFTHPGSATAMTVDERGRVWQAYGKSVQIVDAGKARDLDTAPGIGEVDGLYTRGHHVWLGGTEGIAVHDGRMLTRIDRRDGIPMGGVGGIVERANGDVWVRQAREVLLIRAAALRDVGTKPVVAVDVERFDLLDGLPGSSNLPHPNLVEADDGRLWFADDAGLSWVDPADVRREPRAAPVRLLALSADGQDYALDKPARLAPLNRRTELRYTAIDLSQPERLRFRYRLDGLDSDWHDAGHARMAQFNSLAPGDYVFRVQASDESGAWRDEGAALAFAVAPAWFQTAWFRTFAVLLAGTLLWALHRWRARQLTRQALGREEAREIERRRIARELHDTLLQGTQGLVLNLQVVAGELPADDGRRLRLQRLLDGADALIAEARDRVYSLRQADAGARDPLAGLAAFGHELAAGTGIAFELRRHAEPAPLPEDVGREVLLVVREALGNAFRHAGAGRVALDFAVRDGRQVFTVSDDGTGIAAATLANGRPGHFGLVGMRERAQRLGAELELQSDAERGTRVSLAVPVPADSEEGAGARRARWLARLGWRRV